MPQTHSSLVRQSLLVALKHLMILTHSFGTNVGSNKSSMQLDLGKWITSPRRLVLVGLSNLGKLQTRWNKVTLPNISRL